MKIRYSDCQSFYDGIYELTSRGLGFQADVESMTITLTGAY